MNDLRPPGDTDTKLRVRVWFGDHPIADYTAAPEAAQRYAESMGRRFASCRVSCVPIRPTPR
ncbi:hypothetical protein BWI15_00195 [Kribbella sp. ALI-6-A]|nr:hypothetical protein BWI15_00195 [Kribbella sp. ALI-6-A]